MSCLYSAISGYDIRVDLRPRSVLLMVPPRFLLVWLFLSWPLGT